MGRTVQCLAAGLAAALCAWGGAAESARAEWEYHNRQHGFRLKLPDDWQEMSPEVLAEARNVVRTGLSSQYVAGFSRKGAAKPLAWPYVLVRAMPYAQLGISGQIPARDISQVVAEITGVDRESLVKAVVGNTRRVVIGDPPTAQVTFEEPRRWFRWAFLTQINEAERAHIILDGHFGSRALVQVVYLTLTDNFIKERPVPDNILDSFQFNMIAAYDEQRAGAGTWSHIVGRAALGIVLGGLAGLLIVMLRRGRTEQPAAEPPAAAAAQAPSPPVGDQTSEPTSN